MCVYFCGGACVEDVSNHLMGHLSLHPLLRTCSSDTILRMMKELSCDNITYTSDTGRDYDFNTCDRVNELLVNALVSTGQLVPKEEYDLDFDHEFLEAEKYDAKMTYKHFLGYSLGVAVINNMIVGIENRDGNANVRFHQQDTLERIYTRLEGKGITLYYKVKGLTGESPSTFFKTYKLNKAAELIKAGEHTISEIAFMTGFNTLSHFSTSFKKQFGCTPSEYGKKKY